MDHAKIKVGVIQATPVLFNQEACIDLVIDWLRRAAEQNCELVLFPESFVPGYPRGLRFDATVGKRTEKSREHWLTYWENSLLIGSDSFHRISAAIREVKIACALGVTEREEKGGSLYCTLLYFNPDGSLAGRHRKLKPTGLERYIWAEGNASDLVSLKMSFARVGGLICWENYMPLARMAMYEQGVEIYLAPTADARPSWQATMQHVAREGRCFVLSANQYVRKSDYPEEYLSELEGEPEIMSAGGSVILDPYGEVLAGPLWEEEGLLVAELDMRELAKSKLEFDAVGHYNRKDIFEFKVRYDKPSEQ